MIHYVEADSEDRDRYSRSPGKTKLSSGGQLIQLITQNTELQYSNSDILLYYVRLINSVFHLLTISKNS